MGKPCHEWGELGSRCRQGDSSRREELPEPTVESIRVIHLRLDGHQPRRDEVLELDVFLDEAHAFRGREIDDGALVVDGVDKARLGEALDHPRRDYAVHVGVEHDVALARGRAATVEDVRHDVHPSPVLRGQVTLGRYRLADVQALLGVAVSCPCVLG